MNYKNIIIKGIVFVCILGIFLMGLSKIFIPKNNMKSAGMQQVSANGILSEKKKTIDMLVIGDSESYSSISPMQMWAEHGFTSYVCGTPKQSLHDSYQFIQKALKTQQPKVVILETNGLFRKYSINQFMKAKGKDLFPIFEYHNRWKKLKSDDFKNEIHYTWDETLKGYRYSDNVNPSIKKDYKKKTEEMKNIPSWNQYYLRKIQDLCQQNHMQLILLSTPSTKNWSYAKHNSLIQLSKETKLEFIDLNLVKDISIDWNKDTRDKGDHLNYTGAKKVTKYLGEYLFQQKLLQDHRKDPYYAKWHDDFKKYKRKVHE